MQKANKCYQLFHKATIVTIFLSLVLLLSAASYAENKNVYNDVAGIEEIKTGMKGYGKTVFSGSTIETFGVEILGVLKNYDAKRDLILVKCSGPVVEKAGIISGMSGSPIYINGKIIGALSHAWGFSKEPIAGVTPIYDMLQILETELPKGSTDRNKSPITTKPHIIKADTNREMKLSPIKTPLMVAGFNSEVFNIMAPELDMFGMTPVQSGGNMETDENSTETLEPGSAIGVQLIRGDLSAAAVGTVTYVKGRNILAFGHPFMQNGNLDLPMTGAYVHTILSSLSLSSKMASPTKELGKITQDRKSAISGVLGEYTKMIPCYARIEGFRTTEYNFEVVDNRMFTPNLCRMAFLSAIMATEKNAGELYVKLGLKIFVEELEAPIVLEDIFYDADTSWFPVSEILSPVSSLLNNSFKLVNIKKIEFYAKLIDEPKVASIEDISVDKTIVSPGDTIKISVKLNPSTDKTIKKSIEFKIPSTVKPGSKIMVTACSANQSARLHFARSSGKYKPENFEQLIELIKEIEPNNNLIIHVLLPGTGISYKGEQFPELPLSLLSVMTMPNYSGTEQLSTEKIYHIKTDWVLMGGKSIFLNVKKG